jgi:uncharacterized protein YqgC (DUF456 family)
MGILAAAIVAIASFANIALVVLGLPGIWIAIAIALVVEWWQPGSVGWWALGSSAGLAILAEIAEFFASAAGAGAAGGSKRAAFAAIAGGIVGAVLGTIFIPIPVLGTIIGSVVGAGLFAGAFESAKDDLPPTLAHRFKVGKGAATGRFLATLIKAAFAILVAIILTTMAVWNAL